MFLAPPHFEPGASHLLRNIYGLPRSPGKEYASGFLNRGLVDLDLPRELGVIDAPACWFPPLSTARRQRVAVSATSQLASEPAPTARSKNM
jgi:hypothetical protein